MTKSVVVMPIWWRLKKKFRRRWSDTDGRGRSDSWSRDLPWGTRPWDSGAYGFGRGSKFVRG